MAQTTPTPSEIGKMAADANVSRLILTHFRKYMDTPLRFEAAQTRAAQSFGQSVPIAEDLDEYVI